MRTISLSWKTPLRMTITRRSPASPAARVAGVSGTKAMARGACPSVKRTRLTCFPSGAMAKIRDIDHAARPGRQPLREGTLEHAAPFSARAHAPQLARAGLPRRLRIAVAGYPEMIGLVHHEDARASDARIARVEYLPAGVEAQDHATLAVGDEDIAEAVDGASLRLDQRRLHSRLRRAPREEMHAPIDQPVEDADAAIAVERGDENLLAAAAAAHLRVDERRTVEIAGLRRRGETGAAEGDAIHGSEVVVFAAAVPPPRAREIEHSLGIHEQGRRGGNATARRATGRLEALPRHVHTDGEAGGHQDLRASNRR